MRVTFRKSFTRDLRKVKDTGVLTRIREAIQQVEAVADMQAIGSLEKLSGTGNFYRIRIGDYRIGVTIEEDTVEFVRCLRRRDMYRFFP